MKNVKTWWISMLNSLKCVVVKYKALIVKMHFNWKKTKFIVMWARINFDFAKFHVYVDAMNLAKVELFCLYIDPISNFNDLAFDKNLLSHFHNIFPFSWRLNINDLQEFLGFKIIGWIYFIHIRTIVNHGYWIKVHQDTFKKLIVAKKNLCVELTQALISKLQRWFSKHEVMMAFVLAHNVNNS